MVRQKHSKSLGYDTDGAATYYQSSEPISTIKIRQTPPTKPQRLSLQRTKSLQEVSENVLTPLVLDKKRALKRIHKFEPKI
jgi:ribonuclease PH